MRNYNQLLDACFAYQTVYRYPKLCLVDKMHRLNQLRQQIAVSSGLDEDLIAEKLLGLNVANMSCRELADYLTNPCE